VDADAIADVDLTMDADVVADVTMDYLVAEIVAAYGLS